MLMLVVVVIYSLVPVVAYLLILADVVVTWALVVVATVAVFVVATVDVGMVGSEVRLVAVVVARRSSSGGIKHIHTFEHQLPLIDFLFRSHEQIDLRISA